MSVSAELLPRTRLPSDAPNIPLLRELYVMRQQMVSAHGSLERQIKAIKRRAEGQGLNVTHAAVVTPASCSVSDADSSHPATDTLKVVADSASPSHDADEGHNDQAAHVNPLPSRRRSKQVVDGNPRVSDDQSRHVPSIASLACVPLLAAMEPVIAERKQLEKRLRREAQKLPVYAWVQTVNGFGELGLAQIVGEAGDLSNYSNPAKLWKRMGLAVLNGRAQRKATGEEGILQGYCPRRRSVMFVIGDSLLKKQNPYRDLYLKRKEFEQQKVPDGTKMLWHRRAQRYAEKRLLLDLWKAWRNAA